jgi:uncharacterized protein YicC (UPF0701 family)
MMASTMAAAMLPRMQKSTNHQYSDRDARPENVTYLEKQVRMAVVKFIFPSKGLSRGKVALSPAAVKPSAGLL